mmetsp:Transcript_19972/g.25163  ORF Transcript_19972/g.25163 Transcript_19972/m.25163 type:complete len:600 (+) Transcript_19972:35-1834(+)
MHFQFIVLFVIILLGSLVEAFLPHSNLIITLQTLQSHPRFSSLEDQEFLTTTKDEELLNREEQDLLNLEPRNTWQTIALSEPEEETFPFNLKDCDILGGEKIGNLEKLEGKYFINGLASCAVGERVVHPFEAHGFIKSIEFHGNGTATFQSKYVNTFLTSLERNLKRPVSRGVMSRIFDGPFKFLNILSPQERNTANLACRAWPPSSVSSEQQRLLVGGDNSAPYCLDIQNLNTKGLLSNEDSFVEIKGKKMLAHTRYDSIRQRLIMAACNFAFDTPGDDGNALLYFWEYDANGRLVSQREYKTDFMVMHDWILTDNYYVIPKNPATFEWGNLPKFLSGYARGVDVFSLAYLTNGAFLLIPRHDINAPVIEATADSFFNIFHLGSTYEREKKDGTGKEVVVNAVVFDSYNFGKEMGFDADLQEFDPTGWSTSEDAFPPRLDRFVIDCNGGEIISRTRVPLQNIETGEDIPVDMPTHHPLRDGQESRYLYFAGGRQNGWFPFRKLVKFDSETQLTDSWDAGDGRIVSEPMFIPSGQGGVEWLGQSKEDEGFVFSVVHNAEDRTNELAVLDAQNFGAGPIALLKLGGLSPWSVHGHWNPSS